MSQLRRYSGVALAALIFFIWRGCGDKPDEPQTGGIYSVVIYKQGYGYLKVIDNIPGKKYVRFGPSLLTKRPQDLAGYDRDSGKYFALLTGDWQSLKPKLLAVEPVSADELEAIKKTGLYDKGAYDVQ